MILTMMFHFKRLTVDTIKFKKLHENAKLPKYATEYSNGADIFACIDEPITILPGETVLIPTGFSMELPHGYGALLIPRSGLGHKHGIVLGNIVGLVDSDYRGQMYVSVWNRNQELSSAIKVMQNPDYQAAFLINPGDRIAQMIITELPQFDFVWDEELTETERGDGGFGHTGS